MGEHPDAEDSSDAQCMVRQLTKDLAPEQVEEKLVQLVGEKAELENENNKLRSKLLKLEALRSLEDDSSAKHSWQGAVGRVLDIRAWMGQFCSVTREHHGGGSNGGRDANSSA